MGAWTYAQLRAEGAPELPPGWFYRVSTSALVDILTVKVMRRRRWWFSENLGQSSLFLDEQSSPVLQVANTAAAAYSDIAIRHRSSVFWDALRQLEGDSP